MIYQLLSVSSTKIKSLFSFPTVPTLQQLRISHYLTTMIGNMSTDELRAFMRFVTGSCACITDTIKVSFNNASGLNRHPVAHTCDCSLDSPVDYRNYDDFHHEFQCILDKNNEVYVWGMYSL